jgi:hypothetical protein
MYGTALSSHWLVRICCAQDFLLDFTLDLYNPASPRAHMYATMPPPSRLRHQLNFPQQYLPLLQHKDLVSVLQGQSAQPRVQALQCKQRIMCCTASSSYRGIHHVQYHCTPAGQQEWYRCSWLQPPS